MACRTIAFGCIIITFGISMTILGYFYIHLSQEIVQSWDDSASKTYTNWTKRYLLKSLQYLGPVVMGIGSFTLIVACVITLESRDKNIQVPNTAEIDPCKKTPMQQRDAVLKGLPVSEEEICEWTPLYKIFPPSRSDFSPILNKQRKYRSTPCIPQMLLDDTDKRKLFGHHLASYFCDTFDTKNDLVSDLHNHGRACTSTNGHSNYTSCWQDLTVELHSPPSMLLSNTVRKVNDSTCNEDNAAATDVANSAVDFKVVTRFSCTNLDGYERCAPLASLDLEFCI